MALLNWTFLHFKCNSIISQIRTTFSWKLSAFDVIIFNRTSGTINLNPSFVNQPIDPQSHYSGSQFFVQIDRFIRTGMSRIKKKKRYRKKLWQIVGPISMESELWINIYDLVNKLNVVLNTPNKNLSWAKNTPMTNWIKYDSCNRDFWRKRALIKNL